MAGQTFRGRIFEQARDIAAADWNRCAASANPFVQHGFIEALEEAGCVGPETGWRAAHLAVGAAEGRIDGVMPCYIKSHSQGEYVFDQSWAGAYDRAGGRYYPKLQSCVPFTPVTGPRLLAASPEAKAALAQMAQQVAAQHGLSGFHVTFAREEDAPVLEAAGMALRIDQQFHWHNQNYESFDDFLAGLASRKRKAIRKERRDAVAAGLEIETLTGAQIEERHWDAFFDFYMDTGDRKWGRPYLNRAFFSLMGAAMGEAVVLILAKRAGSYIAGALNLQGGGALYGRYWGAIERHPFLHFELCYYRAIDYAIAHGLSRVEAGAQGEHKLARGYAPARTVSAHWLRDPGFHQAVVQYLEMERREVEAAIGYLNAFTPFRKPGR